LDPKTQTKIETIRVARAEDLEIKDYQIFKLGTILLQGFFFTIIVIVSGQANSFSASN